jgi:MFS family permease
MTTAAGRTTSRVVTGAALVLPLALAQFVASYAGTNMNVAISTIAEDLGTSVTGIQRTITLFTLTMAALMIPGSKLTDIWGRKRCFMLGLAIYGAGALLASFAQGLGVLMIGYSLLEGIGSALLIPPIYILITVAFTENTARAKYFGVVSGAAGLGAAAGPLIGGLVTTTISWRASFWLQVAMVAVVGLLARKIADPALDGPRPTFDLRGAVLSAVGLVLVVSGILLSSTYGWFGAREDFTIGDTVVIPAGGISPVWVFIALGVVVLALFLVSIRSRENAGREPLFSIGLFRNRTSNLGLITQCLQWLIMQGSFFIISVYLQQIWGYNALQTGLMLTPATAGILLASAAAPRMAARHSQRRLIRAGFSTTTLGMALLLLLVRADSGIWSFVPGLFLVGLGIGIMLTSSVNVVQSAFPESEQGDISGLSRSVSNLGSSLGTALVGSALAAITSTAGTSFAVALLVPVTFAVIGIVVAVCLPKQADVRAGTEVAAVS